MLEFEVADSRQNYYPEKKQFPLKISYTKIQLHSQYENIMESPA